MEAALSAPQTREYIDINGYKTALTLNFTGAWSLARQQVQKAQRQQKRFYDRGSRKPTFCVGDRVFVYMPVAKTGKAYKFARLYHGPYRVLEVTASDARVARVDRPQGTPLFVAIDRLRHCPAEISPNESWPELPTPKRGPPKETATPGPEAGGPPDDPTTPEATEREGEQTEWTGRLRPRRMRTSET